MRLVAALGGQWRRDDYSSVALSANSSGGSRRCLPTEPCLRTQSLLVMRGTFWDGDFDLQGIRRGVGNPGRRRPQSVYPSSKLRKTPIPGSFQPARGAAGEPQGGWPDRAGLMSLGSIALAERRAPSGFCCSLFPEQGRMGNAGSEQNPAHPPLKVPQPHLEPQLLASAIAAATSSWNTVRPAKDG
jgi:hypothetical protein